ncbi:hypothetical protein ACIA5A_19055 [Micromonospora sp. NPDC051300]
MSNADDYQAAAQLFRPGAWPQALEAPQVLALIQPAPRQLDDQQVEGDGR